MTTGIIIGLFIIVAVLVWVLERKYDEAGSAVREVERLNSEVRLWERRAVGNEAGERSAEDALVQCQNRLHQATKEKGGLMEQLAKARDGAVVRPARITIEGAMEEEQVKRALAGTHGTPAVKAILALVSHRMVAACDTATDEPRETQILPDRVIVGYTSENRLHDAGRASALGDLVRELQAFTADAPVEGEEKKEAA